MVRSCSLKNCNNSVKQKYRFFLLPSVKKVAKREAWLKKCRHLLPECLPIHHGNSISLCEGHFEPDQFVEYGPKRRTILKPTAVPTIFIPNPPRVCDAMQSLLHDNINDKPDEIIVEKPLTVNNKFHCDNDDKILQSQIINDKIPSINNSKQLMTKSFVSNEKSQSPVIQLLEIKKNCIIMTDQQSNDVIKCKREIISQNINQQYHNNKIKSKSKSFISYNNDNKDKIKQIEMIQIQSSRTIGNECSVNNKCENSDKNIMHYTLTDSKCSDETLMNISELDEIKTNISPLYDTNNSKISWINNDNSTTDYIKSTNNTDHTLNTNVKNSPIVYSQLSIDTAGVRKKIHDLEIERDNAMRKYRRLALKLENFETNLREFLNDDQIRFLQSESSSSNAISWSAETLQRSAKIRCIVGPRAYEYLRSQEHYPLPSFRTLYRYRDISKINEYTDEIIEQHVNSTINEGTDLGAEESDMSDVEADDEHIRIEMLDPEFINSMGCDNDDDGDDDDDDSFMIDNHDDLLRERNNLLTI